MRSTKKIFGHNISSVVFQQARREGGTLIDFEPGLRALPIGKLYGSRAARTLTGRKDERIVQASQETLE